MHAAAEAQELPAGLAAIELLLLTGFRRTEALGLQFAWVESACVRFPDTKTGRQTRVIGAHAAALIAAQPRTESQTFVFPSDRSNGHLIAVERVLRRLCAAAGIADVTPHTLRHTFASVAADLGFSELTIAGLLGHATQGVTQRYVHVDKALVVAADQVSAHISGLLGREPGRRYVAVSVLPAGRSAEATMQDAGVAIEREQDADQRIASLHRPALDLHPICTPEDHRAACRVYADWQALAPPPGSADAQRLEMLRLLIATYEQARAPIEVDPSVDALFRAMQSCAKTPTDLMRLVGRESATQLLSGARSLTLDDLRKLRSDWGVSPSALV